MPVVNIFIFRKACFWGRSIMVPWGVGAYMRRVFFAPGFNPRFGISFSSSYFLYTTLGAKGRERRQNKMHWVFTGDNASDWPILLQSKACATCIGVYKPPTGRGVITFKEGVFGLGLSLDWSMENRNEYGWSDVLEWETSGWLGTFLLLPAPIQMRTHIPANYLSY